MDYPSTTTALKSCYPRGTDKKPVVAVTFQAAGTAYRITKHFGSNKSKFESKTPEGAWKVETTAYAEAHDRACDYAGGDDSTKGLHQLLWLTQSEFRLPDAKKFDANVQAQLRASSACCKLRWMTGSSNASRSGGTCGTVDSESLENSKNSRKAASSQRISRSSKPVKRSCKTAKPGLAKWKDCSGKRMNWSSENSI